MADPVTTSITALSVGAFLWSTFGQGVAGNEAHRFYLLALDRWRSAPLDPKTGLPRNHDLLLASRDALREATQVLIFELAGQLDPKKPWIPAIWDHVWQGKIFDTPLSEARYDPKRAWLDTFRREVQSSDFADEVHDRLVLTEDDVRSCFADGCDVTFNARIGRRLSEWAAAQVTAGEPPPAFQQALNEGWRISKSDARMNLGQAYCLFFREHLKHRKEVFHIYVADVLGELCANLKVLAPQNGSNFAAFEHWLEPQLQDVTQLLASLDEQVQALADGQAQLGANQGEILVALMALATESERGNQAAQAQLDRILQVALDTRAGVELLLDDAVIKNEKLDEIKALVQWPGSLQGPIRPPRQLPKRAQAGEFFGRRTALTTLTNWLAKGEDACVWGPAGMGKTALAAEAVLKVVGADDQTLAVSPFPDGVVLLDLYQFKADPNKAWEHLAATFAPDLPQNQTAEARAVQACRGRRALVVVEGAEEAPDGDGLQKLLSVLAPENRRLILTRNKAQTIAGHTLNLNCDLARDDCEGLLRKQAGDVSVGTETLASIYERLGGHPLALTWAGSQLASAEESPKSFLTDLQQANLPRLHEQGYEHHTLKWLYERSLKHCTPDARRVLAAAGMLAAAPFSLTAANYALLEDQAAPSRELERRSREALRQLVRHGFVCLSARENSSCPTETRLLQGDGNDKQRWQFTHTLAYQFARPIDASERSRLGALGFWARAEIENAIRFAKQTAELSDVRLALLHAAALLQADRSGEPLEVLANYLCSNLDTFSALGDLGLVRNALDATAQWFEAQSAERKATSPWQRERSVVWSKQGDVQRAEGNLVAARGSFESSLAIRQQLAAGDPTNAEWQHDLSESLNKLGDVQWAQGDFSAARGSFERSLAISQKLAADDPPNPAWQRDLSLSFNRLGDMQRVEGDLEAARGSFEKGLAIRQKLATSDSTNAQWQRDLSVSYEMLGNVQLTQGVLGAARGSFETSLAIRQKLAVGDPTNAAWQRDLSNSYLKLGDLQLTEGNLGTARGSYEKGLAIRQKLVADDPTNAQWQRGLNLSYEKLGDLQLTEGNLGAARGSYEKGLAIRQQLAAGDPTNTVWQHDLSLSHERLGDVQWTEGNLGAAHDSYERGLAIRKKLAASDPKNATWQRELSCSYERLGDVQLAEGDVVAARGSYESSLVRRQKLAADDPTNAKWQRDLGFSYDSLGYLQLAEGDLGAARVSFGKGLAIRQKLVACDPTNADWQRDLSISYERLGDVQRTVGNLEAARGSFEKGLAIRQTLKAGDSTNAAWQRDLSVSLDRLGDVQRAEGNLRAARNSYERGLAIRQKLAAGDPTNAARQQDISWSFISLGEVQWAEGNLRAACVSFEKALAIRQKLAAGNPTNTAWQRNLSWSCITLGDVQRAKGNLRAARGSYENSLAIALKLTAANPTNAEWQHHLSASYERLGDVQRAKGDLKAARFSFEKVLAIRQQLAAADPTNAAWQHDLSVSYERLGDVQRAKGDWGAARESCEKSHAISQKLAAGDPTNAAWQRDLAISLGKLGDLAQRVGDLALARKALTDGLSISQRLLAMDKKNATWRKDVAWLRDRRSVLPFWGLVQLIRRFYKLFR